MLSLFLKNMVHTITFSVFVPILALIIWKNLKNPSQVATILDTSPLFSWRTVVGWNTKTLSMLGLLIYFALPSLNPAIFQRIVIAKDIQQMRDSFTYAAGIRLLIVLGVARILKVLPYD